MKKVTGTKEIPLVSEETSGTFLKRIARLTVSFPSEDLNKLVDKINEIIDNSNGSI